MTLLAKSNELYFHWKMCYTGTRKSDENGIREPGAVRAPEFISGPARPAESEVNYACDEIQ